MMASRMRQTHSREMGEGEKETPVDGDVKEGRKRKKYKICWDF
jgi:hypothetical protein